MVEIRFTEPFKKRLKKLTKRYRSIQQDIEPIIQQLQEGILIGEQITDVNATVFKVRAKNSDIPTGKSGGYRLIYQVISPTLILLLVIYAKSDQVTISSTEIKTLVQETLNE
ncbi:MAG: type II toxin-antitoxin system RelE/ParE family toxin [Sphaerospermopsis sp. SIO1G1]|nr:type II toxin-antitoxin system RelE/ParE family toxin [Sphaerospermopsis sp. SIO1G1]